MAGARSINVRYFASLAERAGCASESIEIVPGSDVQGLWAQLLERHPALADIGFRPMVACDMTYASWSAALDGVNEVAFLPPVSGG